MGQERPTRPRSGHLRTLAMPRPALLAPLCLLALAAPAAAPRPSALPQCSGPIQKELLFGCTRDVSMAQHICCANRHGAEPRGYQEHSHVALFEKLRSSTDGEGVTTFFDSVCGKPLFRAPVGRTFEEWEEESLEHGWSAPPTRPRPHRPTHSPEWGAGGGGGGGGSGGRGRAPVRPFGWGGGVREHHRRQNRRRGPFVLVRPLPAPPPPPL
eukprot:COSAG04_NODE_251_length_18828_cov_18.990923_7_plen_212_part_00